MGEANVRENTDIAVWSIQEPPSWLPGTPTQIRRTDVVLNASIVITGAKLTVKHLRSPCTVLDNVHLKLLEHRLSIRVT